MNSSFLLILCSLSIRFAHTFNDNNLREICQYFQGIYLLCKVKYISLLLTFLLTELFVKSLNIDKMMISSVMHLPIYKFDTLAQLEQFKSDFGDILTMDHGYDDMPAFNDVTSKFDEKFFDENSLMLVYVDSNSGSDRYGVNSVYCADGKFCIHVKKLDSPDVGTCDMAGWFITVAVPNSMIEGCDEFDAIF